MNKNLTISYKLKRFFNNFHVITTNINRTTCKMKAQFNKFSSQKFFWKTIPKFDTIFLLKSLHIFLNYYLEWNVTTIRYIKPYQIVPKFPKTIRHLQQSKKTFSHEKTSYHKPFNHWLFFNRISFLKTNSHDEKKKQKRPSLPFTYVSRLLKTIFPSSGNPKKNECPQMSS